MKFFSGEIYRRLGAKNVKLKISCQKWDSNPRLENQTATWTQRLRPLGHPDLLLCTAPYYIIIDFVTSITWFHWFSIRPFQWCSQWDRLESTFREFASSLTSWQAAGPLLDLQGVQNHPLAWGRLPCRWWAGAGREWGRGDLGVGALLARGAFPLSSATEIRKILNFCLIIKKKRQNNTQNQLF